MKEIKIDIEKTSMPGELWAEVCEGYYISNLGRWYSAKSNLILAQAKNNAGYYRARIYIEDGAKKSYLTHLMVIRHFGDCNGNYIEGTSLCDLGLSVDHIDRNKSNNTIANLEIVTHVENCARYHKIVAAELCGDLQY